MRELSQAEVREISGGIDTGDVVMGVAGGWASAIAGAGVGTALSPGVGTIVGAGVGFVLGSLITFGYAVAQGEQKKDPAFDSQPE